MTLGITDTLISAHGSGVQALELDYVKLHARSLGTTDDELIRVYIDAAESYFEEQTGRQVLTATREAWLDAFPFVGASGMDARIELPHPPLVSVVSVSYIDSDGVLQTFDDGASPATPLYTVSAPVGPYARRGFVEPIAGGVWPIARAETGAVRIRYTCGYGATPSAVPALVRGILCFLVGHFDTFRSAVHESRGQLLSIPYGVEMTMDAFKKSAYPSQLLRDTAVPVTASTSGWSW